MTADVKDMDIKIIHVEVTEVPKKQGPGNNKQASLTFENLTFGKTDGKKMQDWAVPKEVWETVVNAKHNDIFNVTYQKNERGFNDWLTVTPRDAKDVVARAVGKAKTPAATREEKGAKVSGTWDEKNKLDRERFEYDKTKQTLIIRQSSLATAAALAAGKDWTAEDVMEVAELFEEFVLRV